MQKVADSVQALPWHQENWQRLLEAKKKGRMPHALLLTGADGMGKMAFAERLATSLLCSQTDNEGDACGQCRGCQLRMAKTHPDLTLIAPEEPGKAIKIDVIREFTLKESLTSQAGGYKVIIVAPADALNVSAANSLLKTLEEPVPWTLMILISANPGQLPATIRSRCQSYQFPPLLLTSAESWLKPRIGKQDPALMLSLASGAPLQAVVLSDESIMKERHQMLDEFLAILEQGKDPVQVAARWVKLDLKQVINWSSGWVVDIIRLKSAPSAANIINLDQKERLQLLGRKVESRNLYRLLDRLFDASRTLGSQLNSQMLLEGLLLEWARNGEGKR